MARSLLFYQCMKRIALLTLTIPLLALNSCGDYDGGDSNYSPVPPQQEESQDGTFRGVLNAINPDVASSNAAVQIVIENDQFNVEIFGSGPATTHIQVLRNGTRCPSQANDRNEDGVVDAAEAEIIYGTTVLPFDSELATDGGVFPFAANYSYQQSASYSQILGNLNIPSLEIDKRVVTIQGVPGSTDLPDTTLGSRSEFPIACGVMLRR